MDKITLTAVVARRKKDNKLVLLQMRGHAVEAYELDENSDRALDLYAQLRRSKGEGGRYTAATLFLRASSHRKVSFA